MKRTLCVLVGLTMCAGMAGAGEATTGDIDIFFATSDTIQFMQPQAPVVDLGAPAGTARLYIWANIDINDFATWNGMGLEFVPTGGLTVTGGELYNPNMADEPPVEPLWQQYAKYRWQNGAVGGSRPLNPIPMTGDGYLNASAVSGGWLTNLGALPAYGDFGLGENNGDELAWSNHDDNAGDITWTGSYLLGHVDVDVTDADTAGLNFAVSPAWITQQGDADPWATVAFGLNDPIDGRVHHNIAPNAIADATFVPEPASLLLLALGALAIRRR